MARSSINKRKLFTLLSPLLIFLVIAGFTVFLWTLNVVQVRNVSGRMIDRFTLTVCEKDYTLENISDGETEKLHFKVTENSDFQIRVTLQDGTTLSNRFGSVTRNESAYHNRVTITVRSNLIEGMQQ